MIVGVVKETYAGERRVALTPAVLPSLAKAQLEILIEQGAGAEAGFPDEEYQSKGAKIAVSRAQVFASADIICQVRTLGANPQSGRTDLELMRPGQVIVGHAEPLTHAEPTQALADEGVLTFAMELMPRISRAQSMDVLSSQATITGYKAVVLGADHLPKMFPMMMTAAGTLAPVKAFIIGAGVAGLQAIATSKKLGAVVTAYDIRPAVKQEVESVGGKFLEIELEAAGAQDKGGYAKAMDDVFISKQQEMMSQAVADSDLVISTAAVPGKKSPVLVTAEMVQRMAPGSVIVDLAAERGGNCELTKADEVVDVNGVTILGPTNLPATVPYDASLMYARNIASFLLHLVEDGELNLNMEDEIIEQTLLTQDGQIVQRRVREILGLDTPAVTGAEQGSAN